MKVNEECVHFQVNWVWYQKMFSYTKLKYLMFIACSFG